MIWGNMFLPFSKGVAVREGDAVEVNLTGTLRICHAAEAKLTDAGGASATANVDVTGRTVTIDPDSGPPGTVVTITGSGFPASRAANASHTSSISPAFSSSSVTGLFTNGSGELPGSDQFTIPASATTSVITLTVSIRQ
mgnify:CR=1 FL=1